MILGSSASLQDMVSLLIVALTQRIGATLEHWPWPVIVVISVLCALIALSWDMPWGRRGREGAMCEALRSIFESNVLPVPDWRF